MIYGNLLAVLNELVDAQRTLAQSIRDEAHSIWMPGINVDEDPKKGAFYDAKSHQAFVDQAIESINSIEYRDGQEGRETQKQKGVLLVGPASLAAAQTINAIKIRLAIELKALSSQLSKKQYLKTVVNEQPSIRKLLARAGISRLCINQAKRTLPVVERAPFRISWVSRNCSSIKQVSVADAEQMLHKLNSEQANIDLGKLAGLDGSTRLAIVQKPKRPTIKANIFHRAVVSGEVDVVSSSIHAPVPILCATGNEMPRLNKGGSRKNTGRSDRKISESPYLPSIRAHLYLVSE